MLRTLVIIRHAKSDWSRAGQADFDRSLNERGLRDAPMMAERLKQRGILPDIMLASAAKRTMETARMMAEVFAAPEVVQEEPRMYNAAAETLRDVLQNAGIVPEITTVFLIAHNPGITYLAHELAPELQIANMPTCGMLAVQADTEDWNNFLENQLRFYFFDYPKKQ